MIDFTRTMQFKVSVWGELEERIRAAAKVEGTTVSMWFRGAAQRVLDHQEELLERTTLSHVAEALQRAGWTPPPPVE